MKGFYLWHLICLLPNSTPSWKDANRILVKFLTFSYHVKHIFKNWNWNWNFLRLYLFSLKNVLIVAGKILTNSKLNVYPWVKIWIFLYIPFYWVAQVLLTFSSYFSWYSYSKFSVNRFNQVVRYSRAKRTIVWWRTNFC